MEKHADLKRDNTKEVCLGIAFGSGIGILVGTFFDNISLGMTLGACVGIVIGGTIGLFK